MRSGILNIPTALTVLRLVVAPAVIYLVIRGDYAWAAVVFVLAAVTDLVDGTIARRFARVSEFGGRLDAIADKALVSGTTIALAWTGLLPLWLALAIVIRDLVILVGAISYRVAVGHIEMAPSVVSKLNTAFAFAALTAALVDGAEILDLSAWLPALFAAAFLTIVVSGIHYVWTWSRKAIAQRRTGER
jgi:cardiolipin synthase